MLRRHDNLRLAETGPMAPAGKMPRRYWLPFALPEAVGSFPFPVRVLSEDLVLYRGYGGDPSAVRHGAAPRTIVFDQVS